MIEAKPLPQGWYLLERHLLEDHGLAAYVVDKLRDTETMRRAHARMHGARGAKQRRPHVHVVSAS